MKRTMAHAEHFGCWQSTNVSNHGNAVLHRCSHRLLAKNVVALLREIGDRLDVHVVLEISITMHNFGLKLLTRTAMITASATFPLFKSVFQLSNWNSSGILR